jgi:hypothetical protein
MRGLIIPRGRAAENRNALTGIMGKRPSMSWRAGTVNWASLTVNRGKLGWFDRKLTEAKYLDSQNKHLVTT